jgi:hypothetical protein
MNTKSFTRLLASTILAAAIISAASAPIAKAAPFGMTKVPLCMDPEAIEQIRQLKIMKQHLDNLIPQKERGLAADQQALKSAEDSLQSVTKMIGPGGPVLPANFDSAATIDKLQKQIYFLVREIPQEEAVLAADRAELADVEAWLRADSLLPPCEEPSKTAAPGDADEKIDSNDLLSGPPVGPNPPVLADPRLDPPATELSNPSDEVPAKIPLHQPLKGFPTAPPLKSGPRPLDGFVDPPLKKVDNGGKIFGGSESPQIGAATPRREEGHAFSNFGARTEAGRTEPGAMRHGVSLARFNPGDGVRASAHMAGFGRMDGVNEFGRMGQMGETRRMSGMNGGFGHMGGMGGFGGARMAGFGGLFRH